MPPTTPPRSSFLLRHRVPDDVRQPLLDVWLWIATVFGTALIATNAARNPDFRWTELKVFFYGAVQLVVLVAALWRRGPPPCVPRPSASFSTPSPSPRCSFAPAPATPTCT